MFSEVFIITDVYDDILVSSIYDLELTINNEIFALKLEKQKPDPKYFSYDYYNYKQQLNYHNDYYVEPIEIQSNFVKTTKFYVEVKFNTETTIKLQFMFNKNKYECETKIGGKNYQHLYEFILIRNHISIPEHFNLVKITE